LPFVAAWRAGGSRRSTLTINRRNCSGLSV